MISDCVFCRIAAGEIFAEIVWQDDHVVAFRDIRPLTPTHVLFIPRRHIENFNAVEASDVAFLRSLSAGVRDVARAEGVDGTGYRLLANNGSQAGQEVPHLHVHLLGGRALGPMLSKS